MKLKLNLFKKLTNEDERIMAILTGLIGCVLLVVGYLLLLYVMASIGV